MIWDSVKPFVTAVLDVSPDNYFSDQTDDFFYGKLNGDWKLRVIPKQGIQVLNFIVVDNESKVQAKAVYTKTMISVTNGIGNPTFGLYNDRYEYYGGIVKPGEILNSLSF
jgi:hypothetical protein